MDELDWKIAELGHDFGPVMPYLLGFCLKFPKFWVSREKSAELASKFDWVRPENRWSKSKKTLYESCVNAKPIRHLYSAEKAESQCDLLVYLTPS